MCLFIMQTRNIIGSRSTVMDKQKLIQVMPIYFLCEYHFRVTRMLNTLMHSKVIEPCIWYFSVSTNFAKLLKYRLYAQHVHINCTRLEHLYSHAGSCAAFGSLARSSASLFQMILQSPKQALISNLKNICFKFWKSEKAGVKTDSWTREKTRPSFSQTYQEWV